jgi:HD-GYP domain-containing protein (c-di-GMP phosphodiesterase class II)
VKVSRLVAVSARELGSWLGLDSLWLERLADEGELPANAGRKGYSFDPRSIYGWMVERKADLSDEGYFDLESLREISLLLAGGKSISTIYERILDRLLRVLDAECGAIFLRDDEAWLEQVASSGISDGPSAELLSGVAVWAAANGEALLLPDPRRLSGSVHLDQDIVDLSTEAPRDAIAVPFVLDGHVMGVLVALRGRQAPSFAQGHLALATVLATELALAVERSRAQEALTNRLSIAQTQLEAYARDVRELFAAEKQRSQELRTALGEVRRTYLATVRGLAAAVEAKDEYTAGHLVRVTGYGMSMLGEFDQARRADPSYEYGFLLHDVGKLGIPDRILAKDGPLTGDEWSYMRRHPEIGVRILEGIPFLEGASAIVRAHHERWDGTGYPQGLGGEDIPMGARLFAVADAFDAMTTDRPYRRALPIEAAIGELRLRSGSQFWPDAVDALLSLPREVLEETVHSGNGHRSR